MSKTKKAVAVAVLLTLIVGPTAVLESLGLIDLFNRNSSDIPKDRSRFERFLDEKELDSILASWAVSEDDLYNSLIATAEMNAKLNEYKDSRQAELDVAKRALREQTAKSIVALQKYKENIPEEERASIDNMISRMEEDIQKYNEQLAPSDELAEAVANADTYNLYEKYVTTVPDATLDAGDHLAYEMEECVGIVSLWGEAPNEDGVRYRFIGPDVVRTITVLEEGDEEALLASREKTNQSVIAGFEKVEQSINNSFQRIFGDSVSGEQDSLNQTPDTRVESGPRLGK